eukprot:jgi/Botrbrau1/4136/Bobra.0192s0010.1
MCVRVCLLVRHTDRVPRRRGYMGIVSIQKVALKPQNLAVTKL